MQDIPNLKILLVGESSVGKTCLMVRYMDNKFNETTTSTLGIDFKKKKMKIDNKIFNVQIFDSAGQEKFRSITNAYFRGTNGVMLCYDVSNRDTFNQVKYWLNAINENVEKSPVIFLVGNKSDEERAVPLDEAEGFARQMNIPYVESSAKTGKNVTYAFDSLISQAGRQVMADGPQQLSSIKPTSRKHNKCNC